MLLPRPRSPPNERRKLTHDPDEKPGDPQSINAQAEFWMKIGMLSEANPTMAFNDIVKAQLVEANVRLVQPLAA